MNQLQLLQKKIANKHINGLLVTNPTNLNYLTNTTLFSFNNPGLSLILKNKAFLFVSPLSFQQINSCPTFKSCPAYFKIISLKNPSIFYHQLHQEIKSEFIRTQPRVRKCNFYLGFEENNFQCESYQKLKQTFGKKQLKNQLTIDLLPTKCFIENLRIIKNKDEVKNIKKACQITKKAFKFIFGQLKPGRTEKEIAWKMEKFLRENGADELAFPTIAAFGPNSSIPHYQTGKRKLLKNDIILIDAGCKLNGYCSDMTRTFFIGKPKVEWLKIFDIVKQAQKNSINFLISRAKASKFPNFSIVANQIDKITRDYIKSKGFGKYFIHNTGHGIGLDVHESPIIGPKSKTVLKKGMVISVEPGIYLTQKFGVRIEDTIII